MVKSREEAAKSALASRTNTPGTCQLWTRNQYLAPSAGDRDGDGDADAVDGWLSEPAVARHAGDRNPPLGAPVAFRGGSRGFGHRAVSLGNGKIRSTDMTATGYKPGVVGTTTIAQIEKSMGVEYLGWSSTITGLPIPTNPPAVKPNPPKKPAKKTSRGVRVDTALKEARAALSKTRQALKGKVTEPRAKHLALAEKQLTSAVKNLEKVPLIK